MKDIKINISKENKEKKRKYGRERYKNLLEDQYKKFFSNVKN